MHRLLQLGRRPAEERGFHQWWSRFRRQHQATAQRCHVAMRAKRDPPPLHGSGDRVLSATIRDLDDQRWEQIAHLLPRPRRRGDQPPLDYRAVVAGILWVAQRGVPWQEMPPEFGPWDQVKAAYYRWKQQRWPQIVACLLADLSS